jgi:hypothetical protein
VYSVELLYKNCCVDGFILSFTSIKGYYCPGLRTADLSGVFSYTLLHISNMYRPILSLHAICMLLLVQLAKRQYGRYNTTTRTANVIEENISPRILKCEDC